MEEKTTKTNVFSQGSQGKLWKKVLKTLYEFQKPLSISEIEADNGLSNHQIRDSLLFLERFGVISKRYENLGAKRRVPPRRKVYAYLNEKQIKKARRLLYGT